MDLHLHRVHFLVSVWNTLPDTVVSGNTIDTFKARLDRFWSDQEVKSVAPFLVLYRSILICIVLYNCGAVCHHFNKVLCMYVCM